MSNTKDTTLETIKANSVLFEDTTDSDQEYDDNTETIKDKRTVYNQPCLLHQASWFSRLTHSWSFPLISRMKLGENVTITELGGIREEDTVQTKLDELNTMYDNQEEKSFQWAIFNTFKADFFITVAIEFCDHFMNLLNPVILDWMMQFFGQKDSSTLYGFKLLALMVFFKNAATIFAQQAWGYRMIMNQ